MGFVTPEGIWFRTILRNQIYEIITSKSFAERGYFDIAKVEERYSIEHCEREDKFKLDHMALGEFGTLVQDLYGSKIILRKLRGGRGPLSHAKGLQFKSIKVYRVMCLGTGDHRLIHQFNREYVYQLG